jgi:hypothetical protein
MYNVPKDSEIKGIVSQDYAHKNMNIMKRSIVVCMIGCNFQSILNVFTLRKVKSRATEYIFNQILVTCV